MRIECGLERSHLMRIHFDAHPMRIEPIHLEMWFGTAFEANRVIIHS